MGEVVIAAVVCDQPSDRMATELVQFCRARLGSHKAPHEIHFLDALPRNDLGKLLRKDLRDQMLSTSSGG
jgi:acyl-coenzyme A synthetase/AMP-(fatty) acid ligase